MAPPLSTLLRLTEQFTPCALGDGNDRRMFESALDGDGIEPLAHLFQTADDRYAILAAHAGLYGGRGREDAAPLLAKDFDQRAVVELRHDARVNTLLVKPLLERATEGAGLARKQERSTVKGARESPAVFRGQLGGRKQRHPALAEQVIEGTHPDPGRRGCVGQHHVQLLNGERGKQLGGALLVHDQPHGLRQVERGLEQVIGNQLGHSICHATTRRNGRPVGRPFTLSTSSRPKEKISSA